MAPRAVTGGDLIGAAARHPVEMGISIDRSPVLSPQAAAHLVLRFRAHAKDKIAYGSSANGVRATGTAGQAELSVGQSSVQDQAFAKANSPPQSERV